MERGGRLIKALLAIGAMALVAAAIAAPAMADSIGPIDFESYAAGNVDGQDGWSKTGAYDSEVGSVAAFPDAAGYGFGSQALRISNALMSGSFGDQTISPQARALRQASRSPTPTSRAASGSAPPKAPSRKG